ncbi:NIPSNAP family protein [Roseobacter sp. HKCCA0434]|uniref:NIPSNAP family protein n=1 Tax=Roseobacter sp. HKCCA0434 TaxID=3079297 RepID=UPI002905C0EA|nr:NIPSNAP family protein [Roseobacter sp. HKCCA0434]
MLTCIIRYEIEPYHTEDFRRYARTWGQAIPDCGADLIGYFSPREGTTTTAYGIYNVADLAAYEAYRARLAAHPLGRENYAFAAERRFIRAEDRAFYVNENGSAT